MAGQRGAERQQIWRELELAAWPGAGGLQRLFFLLTEGLAGGARQPVAARRSWNA